MTAAARVAVIGAGPSGLAAAKSLIHDHPPATFVPTIYERKAHVGGIWPVDSDDHANIVPPDMSTNVSKHIMCFSDLAWDSLQLDENKPPGQGVPTFPLAHQVGKYLQTYAQRYLSPGSIKHCREVTQITLTDTPSLKYTITSRALPGADDLVEEVFDHVIIASGFFANPSIPALPGLDTFQGPVIHSSRLRDVDNLLTKMNGAKKIVVIGDSFSGGEAAAKLAFHLSSLRHGVEESSIDFEPLTVHHVTPRPFWAVPPFAPADPIADGAPNPRPVFRPLDVIFADLSSRPADQVRFAPAATFAPPAALIFNGLLRSLVGTDQSELGNGALRMPLSREEKPPWLIISSGYAEFLRSGEIEAVLGRVTHVGGNAVKFQRDNEPAAELVDVGMIVMATGFAPHTALSFLPPAIRESLEHDPNNNYDPMKLFNFGTMHPLVPSLGFVGFYRGPYFGVMEQQARFLGALWSRSLPATPKEPPAYVENMEQRGQYPMGDYPGLMESFSAFLQTKPLPLSSKHSLREGIAIPARYAGKTIKLNDEAALEQARASEAMVKALASPSLFVAPAIFRALQGRWRVCRQIESATPTYPSGTFTGEANMYPRRPTADGYAAEFFYIEEGELVTTAGLRANGNRSYVYRLSEMEPQTITAWFVKAGSESREVDYLFHSIEIEEEYGEGHQDDGPRWGKGWRGKGSHHLCVQDHYDTEYWFDFEAIGMREWGIGYKVKGPSKGYRTRASYVR